MNSYFENGYLLLKNLFDKNEIISIANAAKAVFINIFYEKKYITNASISISSKEFMFCLKLLYKQDFTTFQNCGKQIQHLIELHRLSTSAIVESELKKIGLRMPVISTRPVVFFNHPSLAKSRVFHTMDFHQDWKSMQGSINSVIVWVPLMDIPKEYGALKVIPGSHKGGLRDYKVVNGFGMVKLEESEESEILDVEVELGDALLFSSFLIHSSGENIMDYPRWSAHFRYNDLSEVTFLHRGYPHPYIYKPVDDLLTPTFNTKSNVSKYFDTYGKDCADK
jgi:phytanoyl-CoA hydroxylase